MHILWSIRPFHYRSVIAIKAIASSERPLTLLIFTMQNLRPATYGLDLSRPEEGARARLRVLQQREVGQTARMSGRGRARTTIESGEPRAGEVASGRFGVVGQHAGRHLQ